MWTSTYSPPAATCGSAAPAAANCSAMRSRCSSPLMVTGYCRPWPGGPLRPTRRRVSAVARRQRREPPGPVAGKGFVCGPSQQPSGPGASAPAASAAATTGGSGCPTPAAAGTGRQLHGVPPLSRPPAPGAGRAGPHPAAAGRRSHAPAPRCAGDDASGGWPSAFGGGRIWRSRGHWGGPQLAPHRPQPAKRSQPQPQLAGAAAAGGERLTASALETLLESPALQGHFQLSGVEMAALHPLLQQGASTGASTGRNAAAWAAAASAG